MAQMDGQTGGRTTCDSKTVLCTVVHRAVKALVKVRYCLILLTSCELIMAVCFMCISELCSCVAALLMKHCDCNGVIVWWSQEVHSSAELSRGSGLESNSH